MIDRTHPLPLSRQAAVVGISRGSVYYRPKPVCEADLMLMRRIDELHLELPFVGSSATCSTIKASTSAASMWPRGCGGWASKRCTASPT